MQDARHGAMRLVAAGAVLMVPLAAAPARAQDAVARRAAILAAEDRRAPDARDLAIIRSGLRAGDPQAVRIAVRALGRLERPALVSEIVPYLRSDLPEVRAEAANAAAQALAGLERPGGRPRVGAVTRTGGRRTAPADFLEVALAALEARLKVEGDSTVRAALGDSLGRLPFESGEQARRAEQGLLAARDRDDSIDGRLGVASGLYSLARFARRVTTGRDAPGAAGSPDFDLSDAALAALRTLAVVQPNEETSAARVRRLAVEALTTAHAIEPATLDAAAADPDPQVRMLAMRAGGGLDAPGRSVLAAGLGDESALVRYQALHALGTAPTDGGCAAALEAAADPDAHVALLALDTLGACGWASAAVDLLDREIHDLGAAGSPRGWHRPAHAEVALSRAAPARAAAALPQFAGSSSSWLRMYAARAAANLKDRHTLETLAADDNDNVREAAVTGLVTVAGHDADAIYAGELQRRDYQLLRTAAGALSGTPRPKVAVPALRGALARLQAEHRDNARDAQAAIAATLRDLGVDVDGPPPVGTLRPASDVTAADLRRLPGARARITIRGVGTFDLALIVTEAPATVIRFVQLAERGYYNGLTVHRVVPDFVVQGGSPGANEYVGDAMYMRDELGLWPHVRGAVGISTRGHDTGDAQWFIDLVDNPRLDHEYTVFAQVLNGIDVVDRILEGDVIDRIEIITTS